jgi:muramidase (phage lysozyme)
LGWFILFYLEFVMSKTAMQTLRQSLDFAYYEASVSRTPGEVLSQIRFQTVDLIAKEREQLIKAFEAGAKLKEACTPEAYYRLVYGQEEV